MDEIFTVDLTVTTCCQIDGEDFVNFCGLLKKSELYYTLNNLLKKCKTSLNSPPRIKSKLMGQKKCFSYAFDDAFVKGNTY